MDYCDQPGDKNPHARQWLGEICAGNESAFALCWAVWNFTQAIDDLIDQDNGKPDKALTIKACADLVSQLGTNPFWLVNRGLLMAHFQQVFSRYLQGDEWASCANPEARAVSPLLRCGDVDLFLTIGWIARGGSFDALTEVSKLRRYDPPDRPAL